MTPRLILTLVCATGLACGAAPQRASTSSRSDARVRALADTFLAAYFDRYPEPATQYGVPGRRHDKLTDNSLEAPKAWEAREDAWLNELKGIDPAAIANEARHATAATTRQPNEAHARQPLC